MLTTPYNPKANMVERYNKTLGQQIRAHTETNKINWDLDLDFIVFAHNNSISTATGFAPFELVMAHSIQIPNSILKSTSPTYNYDDYAAELKQKLRLGYQTAKINIEKRRTENKNYYDKKYSTKNMDLKMGDMVLVMKKKKDHKWDQPYDGPFVIEQVLSPTTLLLRNKKKFFRVHLDRIKRANADYQQEAKNNKPN